MLWLFVAVAAALTFAIAAAFVGSEAFRLGHTPTTVVFDIDEAVAAVADGLPDPHAAHLTHDEVRQLITYALEHFRAKGLSAMPGEEIKATEGPVVVADDDAVAVVLGRADDAGLDVTDESVLAVLDLLLAHLGDIGAFGPVVPPPQL